METLFLSKDPTFTIASWNVNSVRARLPIVQEWLSEKSPDIVCLQETKCTDQDFPQDVFSDLGYNVAHFGQKTFNGVAILSKFPFDEVNYDLGGLDHDQSRYIEAGINVHGYYVRVASVYVPNGQDVGCDKYAYKLRFLSALKEHMAQLLRQDELTFVCGDYNIAPTDADVYDPAAWHEKILCSTLERKAFQSLLHAGYTDVLGFESSPPFTWWDYRAGAFSKNQGLRIDHVLASPNASDKVDSVHVDKDVRARDKTSDHAPLRVICR